uniref:glycosyltransferase n=1 Tax=Vibrio cholerae TaxID=666 RepID=UPI0018F0E212
MIENKKVAVVIPCYRVSSQIEKVIDRIPSYVDMIYGVDDCCDQQSGKLVEEKYPQELVCVIYNEKNQGVGGAVVSGYKKAIDDGMDIVVKLDGDN